VQAAWRRSTASALSGFSLRPFISCRPLSASGARSQQRGALRELAERSDRDHLLGDIGVTPGEARRAASKWFWKP